MRKQKVIYIFDRSYVGRMLTVTNSILQNEKKEFADTVEFYLTYFGSERERELILQKCVGYFPNNKFHFRNVPFELPDLFKKYEKAYDYESSAKHIQTSSVLARFDLDEIWPEITDRFVYLDLDLIVKGSISELLDSTDEDSLISACKSNEILATELRTWRPGYSHPAQIKYYDYTSEFRDNFKLIYDNYRITNSISSDAFDYFFNREFDLTVPSLNAGVFVLNVDKYRKDKNLKRHIQFLIQLNSGGELLRYNDQSILNFIFYNKVDWIDQEWNRLDYGWENTEREEEVREQFKDAKIIHYNGWRKPWALLYNFPGFVDVPEYFIPGMKLWKKYQIK